MSVGGVLMKDELLTIPRSQALRRAFVSVVLLAACGPLLCAQEVHIKVLNARNGKAIANDCVDVFAQGVVNALVIPTDDEGVATLRVKGEHARPPAGRIRGECSGFATLDPTVGVSDKIQISSVYYIACQEYVDPRSLSRPITNPTEELMPSYSVKRILELGVTASNTCGKFRATAKPGELIIFERPKSFWERLRE